MHATKGLLPEIVEWEALDQGWRADWAAYDAAMEEHRNVSRVLSGDRNDTDRIARETEKQEAMRQQALARGWKPPTRSHAQPAPM